MKNFLIRTRGAKFSAISPREFAPRTLRLKMMIRPSEYHEEFWKNHNTLKLTPLDEKLIRDLEKNIYLKKQFEQQK
jgi:hypothetical protein